MKNQHFIIAKLALAYVLSGCASVEHRSNLVQPVGEVLTASVGAPVATLRKQKDLPNAMGNADIFGRKVDAGFTKLVFRGRGPNGEALLERVDVDVHSTATTMSRTPGMFASNSSSIITGSANSYSASVHGSSQSNAFATSPIGETTSVMPPQTNTFAVPAGKTLTLSSGQTVEFINIEPHQVSYRITAVVPQDAI